MGSGEPESGRLLLGEAASERFGAKCFSGVEIYMYAYIYTYSTVSAGPACVCCHFGSQRRKAHDHRSDGRKHRPGHGHRATGRGLIMRKPQLLRARIPPWRQLPAPPAPPAPIYVRPRIAEQPPWRQPPKSKPPAHLLREDDEDIHERPRIGGCPMGV